MKLEGHDDSINNVCFSPDGKRLALSSCIPYVSNNIVKIWDPETGQLLQSLESSSVEFSPDGLYLISSHGYCWDANSFFTSR
jgi:WD40 repeat protein